MIVASNIKFSDDYRDSLRVAVEDENLIVVEYVVPNKDEHDNLTKQIKAVKKLDLTLLFSKFTGYQFNYIDGDIVGYRLYDLYSTRDGLANNGNPTLKTNLFYIYFGPTEKDIIIFSSKPIDYTQVVLFEPPISIGQIAANYFPEIKNDVEAFKYKRQILTEIDPHTSLAYLETQLDLMCLVLNTIIEKDPELKNYLKEKLPLTDIMSAVMDHNVSTIKDINKCVADVIATKSKIRYLQKKYLDTKNGVIDAN